MSPPITAGFETGGDDPSYHQRLKSNAPQTGGDAHFEPAVMGGAGVVCASRRLTLDRRPSCQTTVRPLDELLSSDL